VAISFSPRQIEAIQTTGANLLVSAAAGAGKTAVLVERILYLLARSSRKIDLQNLLVVTFTRAAAREMKDRIGEALRQRIEKTPGETSFHLQLALLDRAPISTLDSFCQNVVRENFHVLGINPGFTVLDADEAELLWGETIQNVFELHYGDETDRGAEFRRLVDAYGGRREDQNLVAEVRRVADFLRTTANPDRWERLSLEALAPFAEANGTALALGETRWGQAFLGSIQDRLAGAVQRFANAIDLLADGGIDDPPLILFLDSLRDAAEEVRAHIADGRVDEWAEALTESTAKRMPSTPRGLDPERKDLRKKIKEGLIDPGRKVLSSLAGFEGRYTAADWVSSVRATQPLVRRFFLLTREVLDAFDAEKQALGVLDFNDLERLALRALQADPSGPLRPGPVAERYRDQFEHVLVDEYQDINELQDAILRMVSRQEDGRDRAPNLFAVGDVKQSIYGFRLADPDIFVHSYQTYRILGERPGATAPGDFRIDLPTNYRCRKPIVAAVNAVFRRLMADDLGGIAYDEPARLVCGRSIPQPPPGLPSRTNPDFVATELILAAEPERGATAEDGNAGTSTTGDDVAANSSENPSANEDEAAASPAEVSGAEREAAALATRLWELVGRKGDGSDAGIHVYAEHPDFPEKGPHYRPARWSDIVILLRAVSARAERFFDALRRCGIPLMAPPAGGLLQTLEARDLLSALHVLDNPCQDIPLAAHLRSPLCRLSDNDLTRIRLHSSDGDFFSAVERYGRGGSDDALRSRCAAAMSRLHRWRAAARQSSVAELIDGLIEETGYREYVATLPEGPRRQANLDALRARALQFDSFARRGLARFLRFLEALAESGGDPAAGISLSPGENAVRVLSIHKSKGLEFPIVCVADLGHQFNMQDLYRAVVTDREWLMGMKAPAGRRSVTLPSLSHEAVKEQRRRSSLAEELRLLYVAMTRAREHLILSASVNKPQAKLAEWDLWRADGADSLPSYLRLAANSPIDWVGPAIAGQSCVLPNDTAGTPGVTEPPVDKPFVVRIEGRGISPEEVAAGELPCGEEGQEPLSSSSPTSPESTDAAPPWHAEALAALDRVLLPLPQRIPPGIRAKLSVTEIKRLWDYSHEPEDGGPMTRLAPTAGANRYALPGTSGATTVMSPTERGTLTHLVLQHLDFSRCGSPEDIARAIVDLERLGLVPAETGDRVDVADLEWFFGTPIGQRFRAQPGAVRRELPFTALLPAAEVYRDLPDAERQPLKDESIVVQGVIDCLVVEPDGLRVVDYKTDAVTGLALEERAASCAAQLRLYARAAEEIYSRPAREAVLVFLRARETRTVDLG